MCQTKILSWKDQTLISQCDECQVIYIWHNNLMLSLNKDEFFSFKRTVGGLSFYKHCLPFPDGEERVILRTPNQDISFVFAYEEYELFKDSIDEAIHMTEVYALMQ